MAPAPGLSPGLPLTCISRGARTRINRVHSVLGYADNAIVIGLVLRSVIQRTGPDVVRRHWSGTRSRTRQRGAALPGASVTRQGLTLSTTQARDAELPLLRRSRPRQRRAPPAHLRRWVHGVAFRWQARRRSQAVPAYGRRPHRTELPNDSTERRHSARTSPLISAWRSRRLTAWAAGNGRVTRRSYGRPHPDMPGVALRRYIDV
jgi:hypothetical protein